MKNLCAFASRRENKLTSWREKQVGTHGTPSPGAEDSG